MLISISPRATYGRRGIIIQTMSFEGQMGSPGGDHPLHRLLIEALNEGCIDSNKLPSESIQYSQGVLLLELARYIVMACRPLGHGRLRQSVTQWGSLKYSEKDWNFIGVAAPRTSRLGGWVGGRGPHFLVHLFYLLLFIYFIWNRCWALEAFMWNAMEIVSVDPLGPDIPTFVTRVCFLRSLVGW